MRRDIVFVHIPKTAGTSLRAMVEGAAPDHLILRDYGDSPTTTPELHKLIYEERAIGKFRDRFDDPQRGIVLSGHFAARRYWKAFNAESFVAFIRNPVDRVLSEFNHFVAHHEWTGSLEEFASTPRFRNVTARLLAGVDLESFGFIGIVERFVESVAALRVFLNAELEEMHENVGNYRRSESLSEDRRNMIADLNREDVELYERLISARRHSPIAQSAGASPVGCYEGRVSRVPGETVSGWLCNTASEFIAEAEILGPRGVIGRTSADLFVEEARKSGHSRSGVCGFTIDLRTIPEGAREIDRLWFRAAGTEYELEGSPITLSAAPINRTPASTVSAVPSR